MMNHRVCVVVGVGPGIGLAVARRFAREGLRIALLARRKAALAAYAAELGASGAEVHTFAVDVADSAALIQAFQQIITQVDTPDVLVYNASAMAQGTPSVLDTEDLLAAFRVNGAGMCAAGVAADACAAARHYFANRWWIGVASSARTGWSRHWQSRVTQSQSQSGGRTGW